MIEDWKFSIESLPTVSARLPSIQLKLLDGLWDNFRETLGPYPFRALPKLIGRLSIEEAFQGLNGSLVCENIENGERVIQIQFFGALLSTDGPLLARRMVQLLAGVKKLYESDLTIKEIGEQSLQDCMGISYADSHLLYVLLKLINNHPFREMPFRLAGWGDDACDPQWKLALTDDVINLFRTDDLSAFLDALLSTSYDPTVPWSREEREKRLTANLATGMSQLWDKPHQTTPQTTATLRPTGYISEARLNALRAIKSKAFDCTRLISMCEELDDCAKNGNVHATIFLTRAILDHIPPVFNFKTFTEVASNYGGGISFRRVTERLEKHTREIANIRLHTPIRDKETVPHFEEVNFASELESVLAELCRLLKREA